MNLFGSAPRRRRFVVGFTHADAQAEPLRPLPDHLRRPQPGKLHLLLPDSLAERGLLELQLLNGANVVTVFKQVCRRLCRKVWLLTGFIRPAARTAFLTAF